MATISNNKLSSSRRPVRFLIGGIHFGHKNVGDEAILEGIVTIIRNIYPDCKISVLTDETKKTSILLNIIAYRLFLYIAPWGGRLGRVRRMFTRMLENILHAYIVFRNDMIICAGATMLSDAPGTVIRLSSLAIAANKRLLYFPGGMNSGNPQVILKQLVKINREFDLFVTRDSDSRQRLIDAGCESTHIFSTVDPAFNLRGWESEQEGLRHVQWLAEGKPVVAIGISNEPDCKQHNQAEEWALIADFIVDTLGVHVLFLPSNTEPEKDLLIMKETHGLMKYRNKALLVEVELQPKAMIALIAHLELMISSRMHQLIFSAMATTPFVGISRCDKTDTFLRFFDITAASSTQNCTLGMIRPTLERTWEQREEIKKHIASVTEILYAKSRQTELLVKRCLEDIYTSPPIERPLMRRLWYLQKAFFMKLGKGEKSNESCVDGTGKN